MDKNGPVVVYVVVLSSYLCLIDLFLHLSNNKLGGNAQLCRVVSYKVYV